MDSFAVTPAPDFFGTIGVALTTTTVEDNTPEGTVPASGQEPNLADNTDIDSYEFDVVVSQGVTGNVAVDPNGDGALSEDTLEEVNISAAVGSPANGDVLTQIVLTGLPTGSVSVQTPNTPTANWIINIEALEAFVAGLTGTNTVTFDRAAGTLTINLDPNAGVTSFDQDIFMQAPLDSDVDAEGVQISVTGQNGTEVDQFTGPPTTIVVDAIVDGSEVTGSNMTVKGNINEPTPNDLDAVNLGLVLQLGNDSTTGLVPFESQGSEPNDFSDQGDTTEQVTSFDVTLTPSDPSFGDPVLEWNTALINAGNVIITPAGGGVTTWSFDTSGLTQAQVEQLVASLAVNPPADFDGDITIDLSTVTTEGNTPAIVPGSEVAGSGLEVSTVDNVDEDTYSFTLTVDTVPIPVDDMFDVNEAPGTINLTFVIDYSSSMQEIVPNSGGLTRLQVEQAAINNLLELYAQAGSNVNVLLVIFDEVGSVWDGNFVPTGQSGWIINDLAAAQAAVNAIPTNGFGTNYTDGVETTIDAFPVGLPDADRSVLYFTSDGEPTRGGNPGDNSIPDATIADWEAFLIANNMQALAVGIGSDIDPNDTDLEDVAFPNNDPANPLIVADLNDLEDTFVNLDPGNNFVEGNVLDDMTPANMDDDFGTDGPGTPPIVSITVNQSIGNVTYTFNGSSITNNAGLPTIAGSVLLVMTALGGEFTFHFGDIVAEDIQTGDFLYVASSVSQDETDVFEYTIQDADGDANSATLSITIRDQGAPTAVADTVLTNTDPVLIEDSWLTFNDTDPNGGALSVQRVDDPIGGSVSGGIGETSVSFDFASGAPTFGSFNYVATDGFNVSGNEANVSLQLVAGTLINGTAIDEILIGGAAPDLLNGAGGADVLIGNGAADNLIGGPGGDLLVGGTGGDLLTGGSGGDIFKFSSGDLGTGVDVINDASFTEDAVDLSELLNEFDPGEDINEFVQLSEASNQLSVDQDGGGDSFVAVSNFAGAGVPLGVTLTIITDADGNSTTVAAS